MKRRTLLIAAAAALALPARHRPVQVWEGRGLGTSLSLRLSGATAADMALLAPKIAAEVAHVEQIASLQADSELVRLNATGRTDWPSDGLLELLHLSAAVHRATGGAFDPTVQPLWLAEATGGDLKAARAAVGWERVRFDARQVRLDPRQALTLNGIAQGWAADRIAGLLARHGFSAALINMGEFRAEGGPWRAAIADPDGTVLGQTTLRQSALAVSSPMGTRIGPGLAHIIGPRGQAPRWQTVAVAAPQAALADALSTAFCLMDRDGIATALDSYPCATLTLAA
ncbi:MAG: FAD:protein FMN transferase [Paracoccaceae bacterium]